MVDPRALLELRDHGRCVVSLPEELFDLDYPGHYFRRIKSVSHFPYFAQSRDIDVQTISLHVVSDTADAMVANVAPIVAGPADINNLLLDSPPPPADPRALHSGGRADLGAPLDENVPWNVRLRKLPGAFNDITDEQVKEAYMVVEYTL